MPPPSLPPLFFGTLQWTGSAKKKTNSRTSPPEGWQNKMCIVCKATPTEPSSIDVSERRSHRKWALRLYWGDLCWWCSMAVRVRWAHLAINQFGKWVRESAENASAALLAARAYLSLRDEGRTQVSLEMIIGREDLFHRIVAFMPRITDSTHFETATLQDFRERAPTVNPIEMKYDIVLMRVGSERSLGVRYPSVAQTPRDLVGIDLNEVLISPLVQSDRGGDWRLLADLASAAPRSDRSMSSPQAKANKKLKSSPSSLSKACGSSRAATAQDDDEASDSPITMAQILETPKSRLGQHVKRSAEQVKSYLATLATPHWRAILRDNSLRGTLRSIVCCSHELPASDESPALLEHNEISAARMDSLLKLCTANTSLQKSADTKSFVKFHKPLDELEESIAQVFGPKLTLDPELLVLQASLCNRCGVASNFMSDSVRSGTPVAHLSTPTLRRYPIGSGYSRRNLG